MVFKLLLVAGEYWRRMNSPHLVSLVHAGVKFPDGKTRMLPDALERASRAVLMVQEDAANSTSIHSI